MADLRLKKAGQKMDQGQYSLRNAIANLSVGVFWLTFTTRHTGSNLGNLANP
jgi:hypothetical protein